MTLPAPTSRSCLPIAPQGTATAPSHNHPDNRTVSWNATTAVNSGEAVTEAVKEQVREYLRAGLAAEIADEENIFAAGFVNSLFAVQLVMFVEERFAITVANDELELAHFSSVDAITEFVTGKRRPPCD